VEEIRHANRRAVYQALREAEAGGEISRGSARDVFHLAGGVIVHFLMDLRFQDLKGLDAGLCRRLAHIICEGARGIGVSRKVSSRRFKGGLVSVLCALFLIAQTLSAQTSGVVRQVSLDQAVEMALSRNTGVILAEKSRQIFQEKVREYWAGLYPSVNASAQYTRYTEKPAFFIGGNKVVVGSDNTYAASAEATQILWAGGKVLTGIRMAGLMSDSGAEQVRSSRSGAARAVRRMYYDVLLASATVSIQREALDLARQHLETMQEQFKQGIVSDLTLLRQKVEVSNTEPALTQAGNLYETGLLELNDLLGLDPEEKIALSDNLGCAAQGPPSLATLYAEAQQNRPEYRQARLQYTLAEEKVNLEKSFFYPDLQAFANRQYQGQTNFSRIPDSRESAWSTAGGLRLSLPIFSGGSVWFKVKQAKIEREQALESLQSEGRRIRIDVKRAWLSLSEAGERVRSQETAVEQARKALKATELRFKNGLSSQLELNDASLALNRAQTLYVQAMRDACVAASDLNWAVGQ